MGTQADMRRIALKQPETEQARTGFAFSVMNSGKANGEALISANPAKKKRAR